MKIILLSDANSTHTKRWVKALCEKNIEILLFSLTSDTSGFYDNLKEIKVFFADLKAKGSFRSKIKYLRVLPNLRKIINQEKPDIIHAHYASSYGLLGALVKTDIPYIISVWGSDVYDFPNTMPFGKQILKYNLKKANYILSTSNIMAKETKKYTNKDISITPFGVDMSLFKSLPLNKNNEFIIGNVKTLKPIYGIDTLIRAASIVIKNNPDKSIKVEIFGEGPQKKELMQLAHSLNIVDKVHFKGFVSNNRLPEIYNSFSIAVSVSNRESFGVVAVEAMSCGCPVITSDADGFTEVVEDGKTGVIVPKGNPEATAEAIQRFIDNPTLRDSMGKAGQERVKSLYDWQDNVATMVSIYNNILKDHLNK